MTRRLTGLILGVLELGMLVAGTARGANAAPGKPAEPARAAHGSIRGDHPRQREVLRRDERERRTLHGLFEKHEITRAQYGEILKQLKTVVREDHADSNDNGGYITKQQQANMNHLLTAIQGEAKTDVGSDKLAKWLGGHPRQAEVLRRDWIAEDRVNTLYKDGKITLQQRDRILIELRKVAQEDHADAQANGGFITPEEQAAMNRQEKGIAGQTSKDVAVDHEALVKWLGEHPRQAEVLRRDWREQDRINTLYADGKISAAQRDAILTELRGVAGEDRADSKANGGFITPAEQAAMNKQENKINGQIAGDEKHDAAWAKEHPRQAEVLLRDRFEQDRVKALVASGQITEAQGQAVLAELKFVAQEDRADSSANGGGITAGQQATMNQQENEVRAVINTDKNGR
ncbi:MAG: hypothetical protein ACHQ2Z_05940 [Elusimicrobiota bacterium]